jgi:hypothetical protein
MRSTILRGSLVALAVLLAWGAPVRLDGQGQALVIRGATLIDGNGGPPLQNSIIVIQGTQITAVGSVNDVQAPEGAQVVNASGKWVVPGLWDCQQNFAWFYSEPQLNQGVTSGCDIGNGDEWGIVHRDAVTRGKIRGPRVWIGIAHLGGVDPADLTGWETPLQTRLLPKTVDEVRTVVARLLDAGADQIMFHDGNSFTPEMVKAGCDVAHARNKPCTQRTGGKMPPAAGALAGVDIIPHSSGIGAAVQKSGSTITGGDLDRYADMDDAKARELIEILVREDVRPVPNIIHVFPTYPKELSRFESHLAAAFQDPGLRAYYPSAFFEEQYVTRRRIESPGPVRERRQRSYLNMIRFHKMLIDAGGRPLIGGDTNAAKVAGFVVHDEMEVWQEGGIKPMHILQAATKWVAEGMKVLDRIGTIERGKLADLIIVNANPVDDVANLRQIDSVIFDGKIIDRGFHAWYATPFGGAADDIRAVEDLLWVRRLKEEYPGGGGGGGGNLPDPNNSPQPAITTINPVVVTQGSTGMTLTITGFNFVARSRVLVDGVSVPWRRVSATELAVSLEQNMLQRAGRFDVVVVNPPPLAAPRWGNGTSNKAHLLVNYRY